MTWLLQLVFMIVVDLWFIPLLQLDNNRYNNLFYNGV